MTSVEQLPLLTLMDTGASVGVPFAIYREATVSAQQFIAHAEAVAARFPTADHVVNLCENRYHFALAWAAACLRSQLTLLPPNQARGVLDDLAATYPNQHTVDDARVAELMSGARANVSPSQNWQIPADRIVALTFTSGSTGMPQAHPKTWRMLSINARIACAEILGGAGSHLVATVPAQHVYGLETSLISAFAAGCAIYDGKPFFPQDVRAALAATPEPRTLVTTPTHLKALLDSGIRMPHINRIVSATAPLSVDLAQRIETAWSTQVHEIYGCTEAGIMARRRTTAGEHWQTFSGGSVVHTDEGPHYRAPQLPEPVPLQDLIESTSDTRFVLRGRAADMIKVAGKRTSLQEITRHLLAIPGITDAAVFVPEQDARPVAFVVAPSLTTQQILVQLADRIEAVFLPRPLLLVARLPRNDVGKLPREALLALLKNQRDFVAHISVPADHPSLPGHFPGRPIVPGVVLLDLVYEAIAAALAHPVELVAIVSTKFLQAVTPEMHIDLHVKLTPDGQLDRLKARFTATHAQAPVLEGSFMLAVKEPAR